MIALYVMVKGSHDSLSDRSTQGERQLTCGCSVFSSTALDVFKHSKDTETVFSSVRESTDRVCHLFLTSRIRNIDLSLAGDESVDQDVVHFFPLQRYIGLSL